MTKVLLVALGGALGAALRYGTYLLATRFWAGALPLGTWIVNLSGCLLIGVLVPLLGRGTVPDGLHLFFVVGLLGAFTTFSTYSLETLTLLREGLVAMALLNALGSTALGLFCVWLGWHLGKMLVP